MRAAEVDINAAIKALQPIVQREAAKLARTLPSSVTLDDLKAAGLEGAWQAARDFNGSGSLQAFAAQRIHQRMMDYLRTTHPAGRSGKKIVAASGDDEIDLAASDDDPTTRLEHSQQFEAAMRTMKPRNRAVVECVLAGQPSRDIAAGLGISASRVSQMVNEAVSGKKRNRTPDSFDPASVPLYMGKPVPPVQKRRRNKFRELMNATPATGSRVLGTVQANSFMSEMKKAGIPYVFRTLTPTTVEVWREPSAEQMRGVGTEYIGPMKGKP
jgi:RNA polymerase sigma factor (sigma-70 family)